MFGGSKKDGVYKYEWLCLAQTFKLDWTQEFFPFYFRFHFEILSDKVLLFTGTSINSTHSLGPSLISDRKFFCYSFLNLDSFVKWN